MDWERISVLREILLETTIVIDVKCTSVRRARLVVLLYFTRGWGGEIVHAHMCCRHSQLFLAQWISAQRISLFGNINKHFCNFCFRTFVTKIRIALRINPICRFSGAGTFKTKANNANSASIILKS